MLEFFADHFSNCIYLAVFLVAMIPTIESKIAIPFALSVPIWGDATLTPTVATVVAFCGTMLPSIFVIWIAKKIKNKTSGFVHDNLVNRVENKYKKKFDKLGEKNTVLKKCMMLATFVAVPLPLTGVYTGSLIAGFTNLKIWQSFASIFVGELISCLIIVLLSTVFENSAFYLLVFSVVVLSIYIVVSLIVAVTNKFKSRKNKKL